jgi:hypothetical protein
MTDHPKSISISKEKYRNYLVKLPFSKKLEIIEQLKQRSMDIHGSALGKKIYMKK